MHLFSKEGVMSDQSSPRMVVSQEHVSRSNPDIKMTPPAEDSPMQRFKATLSAQEVADELKDWRRDRVVEYIQALADSVELMFSSTSDASSKTLASLCLDMNAQGISAFDFDVAFAGSRFGVRHEFYKGRVELHESAQEPLAPGAERVVTEQRLAVALGQEPEDAQRLGKLWADPSGCLALYDQLKVAFGDEDGSLTAGRVVFLLMHFEMLSQRRSEDSTVVMGGLAENKNDVYSRLVGQVECSRRERSFLSPAPKRRM
jgi:hypothetical protein